MNIRVAVGTRLSDFVTLMKLRVRALSVFTTMVGMMSAACAALKAFGNRSPT
jgi:heme O synthase-like polyprenyltransferase